jgi:hypothetical protein
MALSRTNAEAVAHFPLGWRFTIVFLSRLKYDLVKHPMSARERLETLEGIDGLIDDKLTAEVVAAIEPCDEWTAMTFSTALEAGIPAADDLLTEDKRFRKLVALNPSWLRAIRLMESQFYKH